MMKIRLLHTLILLITIGAAYGQAPEKDNFMYGADISTLAKIESLGGVYRDNGKQGDAIAIMVKHGVNCFRLRLFVNPTMKNAVVQDLEYTLKLAKRIKASGARFLLDLHYSDTWADPGHQHKPKAWETLDFKALEAEVERYSAGVMTAFRDAKCLPGMVQVGNEISPGFLWPTGKIRDEGGGWDRFTTLLKAGIRGVKKPLGKDSDVSIIIHIDKGGNWKATNWFFKGLEKHSVDYDIIGLSYYPWWHGGTDMLKDNLTKTARTFKKPIVVVETAYAWKPYEKSDKKNLNWPETPDGQKAFLQEVVRAVKAAPDGLGVGVFWWYPESIQIKGLNIWNGGRTALFDPKGEVLPALRDFSAPAVE